MNSTLTTLARTALLPAIAALALAAPMHAQCGGYAKLVGHRIAPESLPAPDAAEPQPPRDAISDDRTEFANEPSIVGMWHVKFIAMGNQGIPDKTEIDAGYSQWHSDGTEILNSGGRAPSTGSFCLGVWEQTGFFQYTLNHFAIAWDPTPTTADPDGVLLGPGNVRESVTLSEDGNSISGTFTIVQYDQTLKVLAQVKGNIAGTRVTPSTPPSMVF